MYFVLTVFLFGLEFPSNLSPEATSEAMRCAGRWLEKWRICPLAEGAEDGSQQTWNEFLCETYGKTWNWIPVWPLKQGQWQQRGEYLQTEPLEMGIRTAEYRTVYAPAHHLWTNPNISYCWILLDIGTYIVSQHFIRGWNPCTVTLVLQIPSEKVLRPQKFNSEYSLRRCERSCRLMVSWCFMVKCPISGFIWIWTFLYLFIPWHPMNSLRGWISPMNSPWLAIDRSIDPPRMASPNPYLSALAWVSVAPSPSPRQM